MNCPICKEKLSCLLDQLSETDNGYEYACNKNNHSLYIRTYLDNIILFNYTNNFGSFYFISALNKGVECVTITGDKYYVEVPLSLLKIESCYDFVLFINKAICLKHFI